MINLQNKYQNTKLKRNVEVTYTNISHKSQFLSNLSFFVTILYTYNIILYFLHIISIILLLRRVKHTYTYQNFSILNI